MRTILPALALVLAMTGQLSSLVHLWVVKHSICPEHGQLVDEDGEHCLVSLLPAAPASAPALEARDPALLQAAEVPARRPALVRAVAVLAVAPKTSPPVA